MNGFYIWDLLLLKLIISLFFHHLNSNLGINSKWWFNGTQISTNAEISDNRIKKEIILIKNEQDIIIEELEMKIN